MGFVRIFWKNNVQEVTTCQKLGFRLGSTQNKFKRVCMQFSEHNWPLYLKDNLPSNANFWQVGLLDVVLSEYPDKSHNFMRLCPKQGQEPITSWQGI